METIEAIYEHGIFRPVEPVQLAENSRVHLQIVDEQLGCASDELYASLSKRFNSGYSDTAARHNEHQP